MKKKIFAYKILLISLIILLIIICYGALLRHHFLGGQKLKVLQSVALTFAELPANIKKMIILRNIDLNKPPARFKHKNKDRFVKFIDKERNALLIIGRYEYNENEALVDIIDLKNFKTIHTYKHDVAHMNKQVKNLQEFPNIFIDDAPIRFEYRHPLVLEDGSLISDSGYAPLFKIDICSNLVWLNDEEIFHHSKMLDHNNDIWTGAQFNPHSKYVRKFSIPGYQDDSIIKLNIDGKILYHKSITEILIENNIFKENFPVSMAKLGNLDPIHLNDVEPALSNTKYWNKGDIFMSVRGIAAIIHFRPETNQVINYIIGPFIDQHDVDIISNKEISIFNNNNYFVNNDHSEILIYNFETKTFSKKFDKEIKKENLKTDSGGLSEIFIDGSLLFEEMDHGRVILFNQNGKKEWEFVNKDVNGDIGFLSWSRVIEDEKIIEKLKNLYKNKKCLN